VDCVAPPDLAEARRALRRLLDGAELPRLARAAPDVRGDPGVALRALLAASADGAAASARRPRVRSISSSFQRSHVDRAGAPVRRLHRDRRALPRGADRPRAAFRVRRSRRRSSVSPKRWRAGERPIELAGAPLAVDACRVVEDESVGVARLLIELLAKGGSVPGPLLGAWRGDRGLRFACDDGRAPWIYVAELPTAARVAYAARIGDLLPAAFAGPRDGAGERPSRHRSSRAAARLAGARAWAMALDGPAARRRSAVSNDAERRAPDRAPRGSRSSRSRSACACCTSTRCAARRSSACCSATPPPTTAGRAHRGGEWLGIRGLLPDAALSVPARRAVPRLRVRPVDRAVAQAGSARRRASSSARAGARFVSERAGWLAGILLALYAPAVFFDGLLQKASLDLLLMSALLWLVAATQDRVDSACGCSSAGYCSAR
jgi:hypothetical protein